MFRRTLRAVALVLAFLLGIVVVRTAAFRSRQIHVGPVTDVPVNAALAAEHLAQALTFQTVSTQDAAQTPVGELEGLREYLAATYPRAHRALTHELVGGHSLLFAWQGSEPGLAPILLMGHLDVVPIEPGTEGQWTHPPFAGRIADGSVWGRGALDDKSGVLGILEAVELLLAQGFEPRRTVYLAFGHDEEVSGTAGAQQIAALLGTRGVAPEYVLDEGLAVVDGMLPGLSAPLGLIGLAEKGYVSVELLVTTEGGHSSMPPAQTAVGIVSAAVRELEQHPMPGRLEGPTRLLFEHAGPETRLPMRALLANLWLFRPALEWQLARARSTNALLRTTTAATLISGGIKENVLPASARAVVNFRTRPGDTTSGVLEHVRSMVRDPRVALRALTPKSEASPVASAESPAYQVLARSIRETFPNAVVAPSLVMAATDSRYYAGIARDVYRFLPVRFGPADLARPHGTNERIGVEDFAQAVRFYVRLIRNSSLPAGPFPAR